MDVRRCSSTRGPGAVEGRLPRGLFRAGRRHGVHRAGSGPDASIARFDVRGIGLSDAIDSAHPPTIEDMVPDMLAVVDAVGAAKVCVVGDAGAGASAIEFAATWPDRVHSLVLVNSAARAARSADYPYGYDQEVIDAFLATNTDPAQRWTLDDADDLDDVALVAPSLKDDVRFREWWTRASRRGASPATAQAIIGRNVRADMRDRLGDIAVPTLVLHSGDNLFVPVELGRYLADHIPNATYAEIASADSAMWGLATDDYVDHIEEFVTGRRTSAAERVLTTVLFSDIVQSTERAVALGDRAWRALLDAHDTIVRAELIRYGGREVNTTGDGFVASFDSPTQAVGCGRAIVDAAEAAQVPVRVGIHTGECERRGADLAGLAVHIAARVGALAAPGEVLTSRTVRDLVSGSSLRFADRGEHQLKGIPDAWQLFALAP
jgi:class 3 adenylate cyclase/alpha-beta hydrolase superfamily lysophospholipase